MQFRIDYSFRMFVISIVVFGGAFAASITRAESIENFVGFMFAAVCITNYILVVVYTKTLKMNPDRERVSNEVFRSYPFIIIGLSLASLIYIFVFL